MFAIASVETYEDGQIIFKEDSAGDWVYVILSGSVEISRTIQGQKFVLAELKEGEAFGELSFLGGIKRTATVHAVGETILGIIDRNSMDQEFNKLSADFRSILVASVKRFKGMMDRACDFSTRKENRVLKTLSLNYKDRKSFIKAYTQDISNGGLFIKAKNPLKQGEQFMRNLQLPDLPEPMKIKCQVAWAKKEEGEAGEHPSGMGVKFTEVSKKDSQTLKKYIKSIA